MDISLLLSSLNASKNLVGLLVDERDRQKAAAIQIDLTNKIIEAQAQISEVLAAVIEKDGRIQALAERNRELEAQHREKARYRLAKLGTAGQFFAYQLRPVAELPERSDEPEHFVCQPCLEDGKKRVLLVTEDVAVCPGCKNSTPMHAGRRRGVLSQGINMG